MKETKIFPNIDTSFWETDNKEWLSRRKADWPRIETMLKRSKSGKGLTAIKQYFLKGKLPDWEKLSQWKSSERHVDLFMFLWLHPSWDKDLLKSLRNQYINSELITLEDFQVGVGNFLSAGTVRACSDYPDDYIIHHPHTDGHNELLFEVIMGDLRTTEYTISRPELYGPKRVFSMPKPDLSWVYDMSGWLCVKKMRPINMDMIFQYDLPLNWWYEHCTKDEDYFTRGTLQNAQFTMVQEALWRIHNFDTCTEGDSPRTRFVEKMKVVLDDRPFIKAVEEIWSTVKKDQLTIEKPWVY